MKIQYSTQNIIIFFISTIYGLIVKFGFIGFGPDYVAAYRNANVIASRSVNMIGWYLSTLMISEIRLGIFVVPFLISLASGNLLKFFFNIQNLNSKFFFYIIFIFSLFSWPLLISSNNAMRQGLMMSFIFFSLIHTANKKLILGFFFMLLALFTHRSGMAFMSILVSIYIFKIFLEKNAINKSIIYLFYGIILSIIAFTYNFFDEVYYGRYNTNQAIGVDFTYLNVLINTIFIFYFSWNYKPLKNFIILYLYFFSFTALAVFFAGLNWEYERFNMIMMPAYVYAFSICFQYRSKYFYLFFAIFVLFLLTLLTGMYKFGVGVYSWEP